MKKIFASFILMSFVALFFVANATAEESIKECSIKTSAQSEHCQTKVKDGFKEVKGVKSVDFKESVLVVKYDTKTINEKEICKTITDLGYTAESVQNSGCGGNTKTSGCSKVKSHGCSKTQMPGSGCK